MPPGPELPLPAAAVATMAATLLCLIKARMPHAIYSGHIQYLDESPEAMGVMRCTVAPERLGRVHGCDASLVLLP